MSSVFKPGDRVLSSLPSAYQREGIVVVVHDDQMPGVDFGPGFFGHDLYGAIQRPTGYWVDEKHLQHVTPVAELEAAATLGTFTAAPASAASLNAFFRHCHERSQAAGWWDDPETGEDLLSNPKFAHYVIATKLLLTVSEITEGMEGLRKDAMDDKLPHRSMLEVELADAVIRIGDLAGKLGLDVGGAIAEKMDFNSSRPDHAVSNRRKPGGKKF